MSKNHGKVPEEISMIIRDSYTEKDYELIFELYKQWKSMPSYFREQPADALINFGVRDETALFIMQIRDQKRFAEVFGLGVNTPTDWNKKLDAEGWKPEWKKWAQQLTPNVIGALFANIIGKGGGKGQDVKVWMEAVEDHATKVKVIDETREQELLAEIAKYAAIGDGPESPDTGQPARQG
jgi:hypothetical protein